MGLGLAVTLPWLDHCAPTSPSRLPRLDSPNIQMGAHPAHRWARSSQMGSGTQNRRVPRGKNPRWHTGWRCRHALLHWEPEAVGWRVKVQAPLPFHEYSP